MPSTLFSKRIRSVIRRLSLPWGLAVVATLNPISTPLASGDSENGNHRARDLGIPFTGTPGPFNAITDVPGVLVGHHTLIEGSGALSIGKGPVRTGVTAVLPLGRDMSRLTSAGRAVINGTGEMTGSWLIDEVGGFLGPIMLTGTSSVGVVHHATSRWVRDNAPAEHWIAGLIPVVAETLDIHLNDVWGYHITPEHVFTALDSATSGPVAEGNVGGGTGMIAYAFKGGIGTSSRQITTPNGQYTVGVLLQANHGGRPHLRVAGVPIGEKIEDLMPEVHTEDIEKNSLVIIIGTDAPLTPKQLDRLARRASLGVGRNGSIGGHMSGEIVLAFSTANTSRIEDSRNTIEAPTATNGAVLNGLFQGAVESVEEAIINALVAAETMTGANDLTVYELPEERLQDILRQHNRLTQ